MKRTISYLLYILFFGFAAVLIGASIMLVVRTVSRQSEDYSKMEAIVISDDEVESSEYKRVDKISSDGSDYYESTELSYGYDMLDSEEERTLYENIAENVYNITDETDENGHYRTERLRISGCHMAEYEIRKVISAFTSDNPQIFWLENLFGYAYSGDDTIVEFYSVFSASDCSEYAERLQNKIDEIVSSVESGLSEYEIEKYIHDIVLENCSYKSGVTSTSDGWQYFSAYGALVDGEAVCEGYAKSMQILLSELGIQAYIIRGEADGVGHMWNVVNIEGEWYHLDPTWDDTDDGVMYEYFNVTTETITQNHTISDSVTSIDFESIDDGLSVKYNFFIPDCTSEEMNYYNVDGFLLSEFNDESDSAMSELLVESAKNGEEYIYIRFGEGMTYDEYIDALFYSSPYKFYYYIQSANEQLDSSRQIDKNTVSILKNESAKTVRIKISVGE